MNLAFACAGEEGGRVLHLLDFAVAPVPPRASKFIGRPHDCHAQPISLTMVPRIRRAQDLNLERQRS